MLKLFQGIRPFKPAAALRDAFAGFTLAAMNIPQALGYTKIAGMPVVTGLYTLLLPLVGFAAFGSSRYLVVSADSATAAIFASGVSGMAPPASARYVALAGIDCAAHRRVPVIGAIAEDRLHCRLSLPDGVSRLPHRSRLPGRHRGAGGDVGARDHWAPNTRAIGSSLQKTAPSAFADLSRFGGCGRGSSSFHRFAPRVPGPLIAVVGAIAASAIWNFSGRGIAIIGPVARGLPHFEVPAVSWSELPSLARIAASCSIMIITQSAATARVYAARHRQLLDENADLAGLSAANAIAGLSGAFVVNGSPTQTAMVEGAGAQSQVAQLATAAVVALVLLFLTRPLEYLPRCVLGALVFMIAIRLIKLTTLLAIRRESPGEFALALSTAGVVVAAGVEQGILLAMIVSLFRIVAHSYHPHTGVMVLNQLGTWDLNPVAPGMTTEPGFVLYHFGAALFYANANRFAEEVTCLVGQPPSQVRWLIVDAEAITHLDYSAARVVRELQQNMTSGGTKLGFARVPWDLRSDFARHHLAESIDPSLIFNRLHEALAAFEKLERS